MEYGIEIFKHPVCLFGSNIIIYSLPAYLLPAFTLNADITASFFPHWRLYLWFGLSILYATGRAQRNSKATIVLRCLILSFMPFPEIQLKEESFSQYISLNFVRFVSNVN